ncbi:MAG: hypothetical protein C7B46_12520 [Sulfobacillus benefaciens]|uniref:Glycoside hydrolase n=1 Tax=Sulfobacillus benefaciens TaxID=453960 RepID=A0A2T2XEJ9_9FIRM|nr:MAG: hypothetical protein C7B46_12520 [Sulfobacillus benefaciens]
MEHDYLKELQLTPEMLTSQFWQMFCTTASTLDVPSFNTLLVSSGQVVNLSKMLDNFGDPLRWIQPVAPVPEGHLADGNRLTDEMRVQISNNSVPKAVSERYGFSISRAPMNSFATHTRIYRSQDDREFDQVQQTALHTFEAVLILGESYDQEWYLVQSRTYQGWVEKRYIAWCNLPSFLKYAELSQPLVVTGRGVVIEPNPYQRNALPIPVEFGAWLPLDLSTAATDSAYGRQTSFWHYPILFPTRDPDGAMLVEKGLISKQAKAVKGFLPPHRGSLLESAFALLGERYGWGDSFDRHDCSSFIMDVYRTIGVQLPRNSKSQKNALPLRTTVTDDWDRDLRQAKLGDELYMPGHVLLYLGYYKDRHWAIHAFVGYRTDPDRDPVLANQVMVTPLDLFLRHGGQRYGEALTSVHTAFA